MNNNTSTNVLSEQAQVNGNSNTALTYTNNDCPHRLPCGYCRIMFRECPKWYTVTYPYSDIKVTC